MSVLRVQEEEIRRDSTKKANVNTTAIDDTAFCYCLVIERNYDAGFEHVELVFVENKDSDWLTHNAMTDDVARPWI